VSVDDNGVISGVNASSEDRTAAIISNTLSTITTLAGAFASPAADGRLPIPAMVLQCKEETLKGLQAVDALRGQISELRTDLSTAVSPRKKSEIVEDINALATEIARLRTGPLRQVLSASIPLGNKALPQGGNIEFNYDKINKDWFEMQAPPGADGTPPRSSDTRPLTKTELDNLFKISWTSADTVTATALPLASSRKLKSCKL